MIARMIKDNYKNKTLEELIIIRNEKLKSIMEYENKFIINNHNELEMLTKPSPHTIYCVDNEDLIMLTELILEKRIIV